MMRRLVLVLALTCGFAAHAKTRADRFAAQLELAKSHWTNLRADKHRARYRSNWLRVAGELDAVAEKAGRSPDGTRALLAEGALYEDMAKISFLGADRDRALALYQSAIDRNPEASLADDAHLARARAYGARTGGQAAERAELKAALAHRRRGDATDSARQLLATLPPEAAEDRLPARAGKKAVGGGKPASPVVAAANPVASAVPPDAASNLVAEVSRPAETSTSAAPSHPALRPAPIVERSDVDSTAGEGVEGTGPAPVPASASSSAVASARPPASPAPPVEAHQSIRAPGPSSAPDRGHLVALAHALKQADEVPLSAQMGLKVKRVVIDAGHGGRDTGAVGPDGAREKDVTLAVARKLADKLRTAGLEVVLTRASDVAVPLEKRAEIANDAKADLFISVHCNASTAPSLHGVETYSLNVSSDRYSMRLAARENASSERSISEMGLMLADLTTRADTVDSERLAREVQRSVVSGLRTQFDGVRDLGTKEALFYVLLGARMPAVLVETSFISNPTEEKRLLNPDFQDELATSIAAGVDRFVTDRMALAALPTAELP